MAKQFTYDIKQFRWSKLLNTFFADAWDLVAWMEDGITHPEAFPNMKRQFYIKNYRTGNERRFRFVKEFATMCSPYNAFTYSETIWQFQSEDGILCNICVATD
jgi:hypothetical protein